MADIEVDTLSYPDCTMGRLYCNEFSCFTIELPWFNNKQNVSCYPSGTYNYKKRFSPSKQCEVIELTGVMDREYIQIHAGNYTSQIRGCVLVGDSIKFLDSDTIPDVSNSKEQLKKLLKAAPDTGTIKVTRNMVD
tara:strand:- start:1084 stop:1488 length:405 start_codon:yes stop_codon:yes gene_type:complete